MAEVPLPTPTDNAVPSTDIRDAVYAGAMLDKAVTSTELTYTDRLGGEHYTVDGIKAEGDKVVEETRKNLIPLSRQYMTLAAAQADIANIPVNSTTYVRSQDGSALADEYINNGGTLEATGRKMISKSGVDDAITEKLPDIKTTDTLVPLFVDEAGNVPVWLRDGMLGGAGLDDSLNPIAKDWGAREMVPLFVDEAGNVPLWLEDGKINGVFSPDISRQLNPFSPVTDGKTLFGFRSRCAGMSAGLQTKLRIGFTGDSWTEHSTIPQVFLDYFKSKFGQSGHGWIQFGFDTGGTPDFDGVSVANSGWTKYDIGAGNSDINPPPYPTGMDGMLLYTSGVSAVLSVTNIHATSVQIFYVDTVGSFNVSVNGGADIKITGTGTGTIKSYNITGITFTSSTTIAVSTSGNTGVAVILGMYAQGLNTGVEVNKMGNGYSTAYNYTAITQYIKDTASIVKPDILFIILGTNDGNLDTNVSRYREGLSQLIQAWKDAVPDIGIVVISPAFAGGTPRYPRTEIVQAGYDVAKLTGVEFYSLASFMPGYTTTNAYGLWQNSAHLNAAGAHYLLNELNRTLLGNV